MKLLIFLLAIHSSVLFAQNKKLESYQKKAQKAQDISIHQIGIRPEVSRSDLEGCEMNNDATQITCGDKTYSLDRGIHTSQGLTKDPTQHLGEKGSSAPKSKSE